MTRSLPAHRSGGLETHTWDLARGLCRRGHRVFILTTAHPDKRRRENVEGVEIHYINGTKPSLYTPFFFSRLNRYLLNLHDKENFDLIHSEGFAGLTFHPPERLSFVATLHGTLFSETPLFRDQFQGITAFQKLKTLWRYRWRVMIKPLYARFLKRLDMIFVDSRFSYNETLHDCPEIKDKLRIVPLGIDVSAPPSLDKIAARKRLGLDQDKIILFTLSRLEKMKGAQLALQAVSLIDRPDIIYLIGGEGGMRKELESMIGKMKPGLVRLLGKIPDEQRGDYLTAADLFLYPEISQPAFGLVSIESMFHGTPVLASDAGAIPEIVTPEVGWTFKKGDERSLYEKLAALLPHAKDFHQESGRLRQYVMERYTLDMFLDKTLEIYEEALGNV
ncbi:glycosyltransferase family 4 protein [Candidatus Sumerlaeota bacterium]|nr:glycosyltransferase family 4 protein [Candidatus Sumerlaeota bacterium]